MMLLLLAPLLFGTQETFETVVIPVAVPEPYGWPSTSAEADYNIGFYGTQCLALAFATRATREHLGLPVGADGDTANRAALAALALESQSWEYLDTATATARRASELIDAMEYLIPYLENGDQPPDNPRLFPLRQVQSDCQSQVQARNQHNRFIQLETLGGITDLTGLIDCAAVYVELDGTDWDETAEVKAQTLIALGQSLQSATPPIQTQLNRLRAEFMTDFVAQGLLPDAPYHDLLRQRVTFCDQQYDALDQGGYLENHRP